MMRSIGKSITRGSMAINDDYDQSIEPDPKPENTLENTRYPGLIGEVYESLMIDDLLKRQRALIGKAQLEALEKVDFDRIDCVGKSIKHYMKLIEASGYYTEDE